MPDSPAVAVTGMGVVSAFGAGLTAFEDGLFAGHSAIRPIERFDTTDRACRHGAELAGWTGHDLVRKADRQTFGRVSLLAMAATDEAFSRAGLDPATVAAVTGVMMGCAFGPAEAIQESVLRAGAGDRLRPATIVSMMLNAPTAALCTRYGLQGVSTAHSSACAASAHAIGQAARAVRDGEVEICLAGGAEAFPSSALFAAWDALGVMTPEPAMRPFAPDRRGFAIGEGAAVLVLERAERARARGAPILALLSGVGAVSDAPSPTRPTLAGMIGAMRAALADAGLDPDEVGHLNSHGTATELNDALEAEAIAAVFGARDMAVSAVKVAIGHCMGAGSALEAVATILALQRRQAPSAVDPASGAPRGLAPITADAALSNSFAFGGHFASLAFRRAPPSR